ncbi:MAG TPA: hypothetical protein VKW78_20280 [Terriglobales bacterium]|nr:hypothetical protein [Terriglobales bacterium]
MNKISLVAALVLSGVLALAQEPAPVELASAKPSADTVTVSDIPPVASAMSLPAGTAIRIKMDQAISTFNKRGDRFSGRVTEAVSYQGKVVIPAGSLVQGDVLRTSSPRRIKGKPMIDLHPELVSLPNGQSYLIAASVVDTDQPKIFDVTQEGQIKGPGHSRSDLVIGGIGTGFGVGIGALAAGPEGALIGAGVGATAGTVRWLINRNDMIIPAGTGLILELNRAMDQSSSQITK